MSGSADDPTADDVLAQVRALRVADLLHTTAATLASLAYGKLEIEELDDARLAIDALRALVPLLAGQLGEPELRGLEQALANLQLAYASAVAAQSGRATN